MSKAEPQITEPCGDDVKHARTSRENGPAGEKKPLSWTGKSAARSNAGAGKTSGKKTVSAIAQPVLVLKPIASLALTEAQAARTARKINRDGARRRLLAQFRFQPFKKCFHARCSTMIVPGDFKPSSPRRMFCSQECFDAHWRERLYKYLATGLTEVEADGDMKLLVESFYIYSRGGELKPAKKGAAVCA